MGIYKKIQKPLSRIFGAGVFICVLFLSACAETDITVTTGGPVIILGEGKILATPAITAASGATVSILNKDSSPHTVTSQSAAGAFDDTGVFDVILPAGGADVFTLPSDPSGTVIHFYSRFDLEALAPADGTITIE